MMRIEKIAIIIFILSSVSFAQSCIADTTNIIIQEQGTNIGLVVALTTIIIALAYMIGSITGNPNAIVFSKDELFHLGFSLLLLLSFSGLMMFSCGLTGYFFSSTFENLEGVSSCYGTGTGMADVASCYLTRLEDKTSQMASYYISKHISLLMDSSFSIAVPIPLSNTYTMIAGSYKRMGAQQYEMVLNTFLLPALMSISMQKLVLTFISENVIRWVLPIGFLLRVFIPTRQMGNILIALSVGLYLVIPLFYSFNLAMYDSVLNDCTGFDTVAKDFFFGECLNPYGFWNLARIIPQAFFLPNLTIALFITFMTAVNKALRVIG